MARVLLYRQWCHPERASVRGYSLDTYKGSVLQGLPREPSTWRAVRPRSSGPEPTTDGVVSVEGRQSSSRTFRLQLGHFAQQKSYPAPGPPIPHTHTHTVQSSPESPPPPPPNTHTLTALSLACPDRPLPPGGHLSYHCPSRVLCRHADSGAAGQGVVWL